MKSIFPPKISVWESGYRLVGTFNSHGIIEHGDKVDKYTMCWIRSKSRGSTIPDSLNSPENPPSESNAPTLNETSPSSSSVSQLVGLTVSLPSVIQHEESDFVSPFDGQHHALVSHLRKCSTSFLPMVKNWHAVSTKLLFPAFETHESAYAFEPHEPKMSEDEEDQLMTTQDPSRISPKVFLKLKGARGCDSGRT